MQSNRGSKADEIGKYEAFLGNIGGAEEEQVEEQNQQETQEKVESSGNVEKAKKNTKKPARFTKKQMVNDGRYVYYALAGKTSDEEQKKVIEIINRLDENYVIDFLNGYYEKRNEQIIKVDHIIRQIATEYGWSDEQRQDAGLMIGDSVLGYLNKDCCYYNLENYYDLFSNLQNALLNTLKDIKAMII